MEQPAEAMSRTWKLQTFRNLDCEACAPSFLSSPLGSGSCQAKGGALHWHKDSSATT